MAYSGNSNHYYRPYSNISIADLTLEEGRSGYTTINRTGNIHSYATVNVRTEDGSARAVYDYDKINTNITFRPGETTKRFQVWTKEDSLYESTENFRLRLSPIYNRDNYTRILDSVGNVNIIDNDRRGFRLPNGFYIDNINKRLTGTNRSESVYLDNYLRYFGGNNIQTVSLEGGGGNDNLDSGNFFNGNSYKSVTLNGGSGDDTLVARRNGNSRIFGGSGFDEVLTDTRGLITMDMKYYNRGGRLIFEEKGGNPYKATRFEINNDVELLKDFSGNYLILDQLRNGYVNYISNAQAMAYKRAWQNGNNYPIKFPAQSSYYKISDAQSYEGDTIYAKVSRTGNTSRGHNLNITTTNGTAYSNFDYHRPDKTIHFAPGQSSKMIAISTVEDNKEESDENFTLTLSSIDPTAKFNDPKATLTILNDDNSSPNSFSPTINYNINNSKNYSVRIGGDVNIGNTENNIRVDYKFVGTAGRDKLQGFSGEKFGADLLDGKAGNDELVGFRGADFLIGGSGNDEIRAGNGRDVLTGGIGSDTLFGGFGSNTFNAENDGAIDKLYIKSDQLAYNWIYGKAGNSPNGEKVDNIGKLDSNDQIFIQGATTSQLTFGSISHTTPHGDNWKGIGIYAAGNLEAVFTGGNLSQTQLQAMTFGAPA